MAIDTSVTLARLIAEFKQWADANPMVNDFGYGQYLETFRSSENKYCALIINAPSSTSEPFYINFSIEVICLDYVLDEKQNRDRVNSDTMEVLRQLENTIGYSVRWKEFSKLDGGFTSRKVDEFGADKCFGWIATFTLKIKRKHGICDLKAMMPTYDFQTGNIVYPSCDPATVNVNEDLFANVPSGENLNITVEYQTSLENPIASIDGDTIFIVDPIPLVCDDVIVTINGEEFKTVASGDTLDILVEYESGVPVGTLEPADNMVFIPNPIVIPTTRIYTKTIDSGSLVSYADGDTYWRKINNIGKLIQSEVGVTMRLQFGSQHLLEYNNIFGHLFRITGLTGGYYNPATSQYYTKLGVLSTYADVFTNNIGVDHLTSDLIDMRATASNRTWSQHCADGLARTTAGFTGWYLLSVPEAVNYGNWGTSLSYNNGNPPFDWSANLKLLGDTYAGGTTQCMVVQTFGHITSTSKANNNRAVFIKPININTDIIIT